MLYPDFLVPGGTAGFVAPSFGCATEPYITGFKRAQERLKNMGLNINNGPNVYEAKGIGISNTPQLCGKELSDMYAAIAMMYLYHVVAENLCVKSLSMLTGIR